MLGHLGSAIWCLFVGGGERRYCSVGSTKEEPPGDVGDGEREGLSKCSDVGNGGGSIRAVIKAATSTEKDIRVCGCFHQQHALVA